PNRLTILGLCLCTLLTAIYAVLAQDSQPQGRAITQGLSVGDVSFTYTYPTTWREIRLESMLDRGGAVALVEQDEIGLEIPAAVSALFLVEAERAIEVFQDEGVFPFPIRAFSQEPE